MANRMKVTAIISDNLISEVKKYAKGKNLTESLTIALKEWLAKKNCFILDESEGGCSLWANRKWVESLLK
ncbi:unnamed protein product [marine sediment metagenome]|uniref:DUF2191 domain-containing protein n=1 Tax=marine sediment metagenome TaxID=412755 RepID=X1C1I4_9ZZZZ